MKPKTNHCNQKVISFFFRSNIKTKTAHLPVHFHYFCPLCLSLSVFFWLLAHVKCSSDKDVPFLFPPLPLVYPVNTASIIPKTEGGRERGTESGRPLLHMTSVLYWSRAGGTHNSTFVLRSTLVPMSSHSPLIVCMREEVTSKHNSVAAEELLKTLSLWLRGDFFSSLFFYCLFSCVYVCVCFFPSSFGCPFKSHSLVWIITFPLRAPL